MTFFMQITLIGAMTGAVYGLVALGFVLIYKGTKVFNMAQGSMAMLGAWVMFEFMTVISLPVWLSLLFALAIGIAIGFLSNKLLMQPLIGQPPFSAVMITIALWTIVRALVTLFWSGYTVQVYRPPLVPPGVIKLGGIILPQQYIASFAVAMICLVFFYFFFSKSRLGLNMRAAAEDHTVAQSIGISVKSTFSWIWMISAALSFVAGILLGTMTGLTLELDAIGLKAIPVAMLGGLESVGGVMLAGIIIGIIEALVSGYIDPYVGGGLATIVPYIVMILVLFVRPQGLFGLERIERV